MRLHIPGFIKHDFPRKAAALFFAILVWYAVNQQLREVATVHDVPVTLRYEPDKVQVDQRLLTASVTLRGARQRLRNLQSNDLKITAEIPVVREGVYQHDIHLGTGNVKAPFGVRVEAIDPESMRVQLDRIVTRQIPVRVRQTGDLASGYKITDVRVVPSTVDVTGPSRILNEVNEIVTEPVALDDTLVSSFEVDNVALVPVARLRIMPASVHVTYEISKQSSQQAFADLPINVLRGTNSNLQMSSALPLATVTLRGPKLTLENTRSHMILPFIDISSVTSPGRYTCRVNVWLESPSKLTVDYIFPAEVEVVLGHPEEPVNPPLQPPSLPANEEKTQTE